MRSPDKQEATHLEEDTVVLPAESGSRKGKGARINRRTALRRLGKGSLATLISIATLFGSQGVAQADGYEIACCHLAKYPTSNCISTCQETVRYWFCYMDFLWKCSECQKGGSTCWDGTEYICSSLGAA